MMNGEQIYIVVTNIYIKYFKFWKGYKDDLIQEGVMCVLENNISFKENNYEYIIKSRMKQYLDIEKTFTKI